MALNTNPSNSHPDGGYLIVGSEGELVEQDGESGKIVYRRGATAAQGDIDVGDSSDPFDLIAEDDYSSGKLNAGGAEALAGEFVSDDGNTFTVYVDWVDDDDGVVLTHSPQALTDVTEVDFNMIMRSDRFQIRIEDTSDAEQNRIRGTANAH